MGALHWTKFQDFYLRLGFLKVLVAVLNPQRPSVNNDSIIRRIERPLFEPAKLNDKTAPIAAARIRWYDKAHSENRKLELPSVAEARLVAADLPSFLIAITGPTAYKILDWGHNAELVGHGNQLTERGAILRALLPQPEAEAFFAGDVEAWNPFVLTMPERLFFLYHLMELDGVLAELAVDLGAHNETMEIADASRMTCHALFRVLRRARPDLALREVAELRTARELACVIARELKLEEYEADCGVPTSGRLPKPKKVPRRGSVRRADGAPRKTTKNADHQTVPRFEQLVDLGFATKPGGESAVHGAPDAVKPSNTESPAEDAHDEGRRRWRYTPTEVAYRWSAHLSQRPQQPTGGPAWNEFAWDGFAAAACAAFDLRVAVPAPTGTDLTNIVSLFWRAYRRIRRPVGHTPLDSVALLAMIDGVCSGIPTEMSHFHRLLLSVKQRNVLPDHAFFASGNDLDKMFILLKNGAPDHLIANASRMTGWEHS